MVRDGATLKQHPPNRAIVLRNKTCAYCGSALAEGSRTKEHVIGRCFVPKATLDGSWNLVLFACGPCNQRKSDLEDDISAITMQPNAAGQHASDEEILAREAIRKAENCLSRRTNRLVKASQVEFTMRVPFAPGIELTARVVGPAQADEQRVYELARLHLTGFFYLLSYDYSAHVGHYWPGSFYPLHFAFRGDWGNELHRAFMTTVSEWPPRLIASAADGFFKTAIRRHPDAECWSAALEWNKNLRVIGFFGRQDAAERVASGLPRLKCKVVAEEPGVITRYRSESPLTEHDDTLFR